MKEVPQTPQELLKRLGKYLPSWQRVENAIVPIEGRSKVVAHSATTGSLLGDAVACKLYAVTKGDG